ncbi:MAG: AAA family ATPase [Thermodesulfobacteriota bacterium]
MITKIELINFMSHRHTVIEPAKGLTVIVGENNTGKSALVSALQVLCRNAPGDYMVRHGCRECVIRVVTDEGDDIQWRRKNRIVSYVINGVDIHRLGGSVPEELHERLRLGLVETDSDPFEIHFGEQKKPIFLLNESASRRATFFASSSDTIKLIEMQNLHRHNVQEAKTLESELARQEALLTARLEKLAPIDDLGCRIDALEAEHRDLSGAMDAAARLYETAGHLEESQQNVFMALSVAEAMAALSSPPLFFPVDPLQRIIARMVQEEDAMGMESRRKEVLRHAESPPSFLDTEAIAALIGQIEAFSLRLDQNRGAIEAFGRLPSPPPMADIPPLYAMVRRIENARTEVAYFESCAHTVLQLSSPPEMPDVFRLRTHIGKMESAIAEAEKIKADLKQICLEIADAGEALKRRIKKEAICPTCGQEMDPAAFIDMTPLLAGRGT